MDLQDRMNQANELGNTIAKLLAQPSRMTMETGKVVDGLVAAMAAKAHELLNPPAIKATSPSDDIIIGFGDTAHIRGNGEVEVSVSGDLTYVGNLLADGGLNPIRAADHAIVKTPLRMAQEETGPNLQAYFENNMAMGVIDFSLRATRLQNGVVGFYLHPASVSGETAQFIVEGNALTYHVGA